MFENAMVASVGAMALVFGGGFGLRTLAGAPARPDAETFSGSFIFGAAVCGALVPATAAAGVPTLPAIAAFLLFLTFAGITLQLLNGGALPAAQMASSTALRPSPAGMIAIALGAIFLIHAALASGAPPAFGDEVTLWCYKSAVLAETGRHDPGVWTLAGSRGPSYPAALPATGALASLVTDRFAFEGCRATAWTAAASFLCAMYALIQTRFRGWTGLVVWLAIVTTPLVLLESTFVMADLLFTASLAHAAGSALKRGAPLQTALALAAPATIKLEGLPASLAMLAVWSAAPGGSFTGAVGRATTGALAFGLLAAPWFLFLWSRGLSPLTGESFDAARSSTLMEALRNPGLVMERAGAVLRAFFETATDPASLGLVVAILVLTLGLPRSSTGCRPPRKLALLLALAMLAAKTAAFVVAPEFDWQLDVARTRAVLHLVPALVLMHGALSPGRNLSPQANS